MRSNTYEVVLFLHIFAAVVAFAVAGVMHLAMFRLKASEDTREMRAWAPVVKGAEPLLPISALALIALGGYLLRLSDDRFGWGDGWVLTAIITLVLVEVVGAAVLGPRTKKLVHAIVEAPAGAPGAELRRATTDPAMWLAGHISTGAVFGIVYLMVAKPSGTMSVVTVVVAALVGAATALPLIRGERAPAPAATAT